MQGFRKPANLLVWFLAACACLPSCALQPAGFQKRGWQGDVTGAGSATRPVRPRGWSTKQQALVLAPDVTPSSLNLEFPHQDPLAPWNPRSSWISSLLLLVLLAADFLAGYALGCRKQRMPTRHAKVDAGLNKTPMSSAEAPGSITVPATAAEANLQRPQKHSMVHSCVSADPLECSIQSQQSKPAAPENEQGQSMALDQCASRIQPCSSVADIQSVAGPQSTLAASNADDQIHNESFQAESSASATTAALSMRSQIPQETVPEPSTAPENGSPVEPNIITDLASPSSRPLALPRDPVEVVQGGRTRAALGMRTMISHEGNHLSLRDAETWDWMMSVLHRVGLSEADLATSTAKWKLAALLPQYGSVLASVISTHDANRRALEAADIQRERTSIARKTHNLQAQQSLEQQELQATNRMLMRSGDCLICGLIIMAASLAWTAWRRGLAQQLTRSCQASGHLIPGGYSWLLPRAVQEAAAMCLCYARVLGLWLLGMIAVAVIGWIMRRSNSLREYHKTPMVSLVLGLMLACGWGGWYSVAGLGGHQATWLLCWESWTLLHLLAASYPSTLSSALKAQKPQLLRSQLSRHRDKSMNPRASAQGQTDVHNAGGLQSTFPLLEDTADSGRMRGEAGLQPSEKTAPSRAEAQPKVWQVLQHCKTPMYCIIMGLLLPALTGWLPFHIRALPGSLQPAALPSAPLEIPPGLEEWAIPLEPYW